MFHDILANKPQSTLIIDSNRNECSTENFARSIIHPTQSQIIPVEAAFSFFLSEFSAPLVFLSALRFEMLQQRA